MGVGVGVEESAIDRKKGSKCRTGTERELLRYTLCVLVGESDSKRNASGGHRKRATG
jgi:hypothetical protein